MLARGFETIGFSITGVVYSSYGSFEKDVGSYLKGFDAILGVQGQYWCLICLRMITCFLEMQLTPNWTI